MAREGVIFPYQKLLDLKEQQELALKLEIGLIERAILDLIEEKTRWLASREETFEKLRQARARVELDLADQYPSYLEYLRAQIVRCAEKIREWQDKKEETRKELERTMQSRKLLERFKERRMKEYEAQLENAEQRNLDAFSVQRFISREATT